MICLVLFLLLSISSFMMVLPENKIEEGSAAAIVQTKEQTEVIAGDTAKQAEQKKKKDAPSQAPVTTSFFAKKTLSNMDFDELKKYKEDCLKAGDKKTAIKYLDRMAQIKTDLEDLKGIMLELAQLLFEVEDYKRASDMYNKFVLLYPGCDELELSTYRAIFSMSKLMLDAEHDQTKTVETKELAQEFLSHASFTHYKKEVEMILVQCEQRLFESEINIFKFYLNRGNYVAAQTRLSNIKETYGAKSIPDVTIKLASLDKHYAEATVCLKPESLVVVAQDDDKNLPATEAKAV